MVFRFWTLGCEQLWVTIILPKAACPLVPSNSQSSYEEWLSTSEFHREKIVSKGRYKQAWTQFLLPKSALVFSCCITHYYTLSNLKHYSVISWFLQRTFIIFKAPPRFYVKGCTKVWIWGSRNHGATLEFCLSQSAIDTLNREMSPCRKIVKEKRLF